MLRVATPQPSRLKLENDIALPPRHEQPHFAQVQPAKCSNAITTLASKAYRSSTSLFLTRRLPEALAALHPIINAEPAAIAQCRRGLRIKLWTLYVAILDAALKVGASEGKALWGQREWTSLVSRVRSGAIWEVINRSYGDEGRVDPEVVVSLSTLLLSHAPDQTCTQRRIEAYFGAAPNFPAPSDEPISVVHRAKITEILVLHVLPRLGEWEYAMEFIQLSPDIDEEKKENFYITLNALQKDKDNAEIHSRELQRLRDEELELEHSQAPQEVSSVLPPRSRQSSRTRSSSARPISLRTPPMDEHVSKPKRPVASPEDRSTGATVPNRAMTAGSQGSWSAVLRSMNTLLAGVEKRMGVLDGPLWVLRTVLILVMIAWMTGNRKIRERVRKVLILCWIKIYRTAGMGMKVTYV